MKSIIERENTTYAIQVDNLHVPVPREIVDEVANAKRSTRETGRAARIRAVFQRYN
jgi:predicted SPOUT superfamily RNA methylase MTH1